jgi:hypothetical protein
MDLSYINHALIFTVCLLKKKKKKKKKKRAKKETVSHFYIKTV